VPLLLMAQAAVACGAAARAQRNKITKVQDALRVVAAAAVVLAEVPTLQLPPLLLPAPTSSLPWKKSSARSKKAAPFAMHKAKLPLPPQQPLKQQLQQHPGHLGVGTAIECGKLRIASRPHLCPQRRRLL